ncbi:MAG: CHAT domain-containing protein, partial [Bacteroidales bacterium]|nr:CHAT domain-containing protein [Bacteroidales bacterium]
LALYNSEINNLSEAIKLENLALEIRRKALGEDHSLFAISLEKLALYNYKLDNNSEAIRLENQVKEIYQKAFGEAHPYYAEALRDLAKYNFNAGNHTDAVEYYKQGYDRTSSFVMKNFSWMTSNERMNYWKKFSDFYGTKLPYAAYSVGTSSVGTSSVETSYYGVSTPSGVSPSDVSTITALAYNGLVFSKGLLLNAELEIQNLIEQSGDTTLANQFYKLKSDRSMLDNLYQLPPDERYMDADSLSKVIEKEERLLVESCKEIGDYTRNLSIDWREIQKNLKDGDLAIEFANFKDTSRQDIYIALVLKKGMSSPEIVKLFESDDFNAIKKRYYYKTPKIHDLIWKPLAKHLEGVKNVYFSPSGQFHTIGIEYLPDEDGKIFAERYDAYRLSSTRELALSHTINPNKKAATYGGIKYNFTEEDWLNLKNEKDTLRQMRLQDAPLIAANLRGGGVNYLIGTRDESIAVANLLRSADYDVSALSGDVATEETFKNLSGTGLQILHIGTHGFYESEADLENAGLKFYTNSQQQNDEDRSMSCSGLLFAGVNSTLDPKRNKEIPEGFDDGVLTAKEISRLDFKGLDLVVLSACQTGLGAVTGEGVFGLQRGFKKAGAQTLVMSLWKVFDESTQLLMTEFFKNLTAGQSKRAAFIAAQAKVRAQFPDPEHWAAFVMVDGKD